MTLNIRLALISLVVVLGVSLMVKIDPVTADIGRHIKNGEIILSGNSDDRSALLTTNYYSYTQESSPFVNHHWLSGVIFFILYSLIGFTSLSIFYILCILVAFYLVIDIIKNKIHPIAVFLISLIAIPVIASRAEVRPEVFTYLFVSLFVWLCFKYSENAIDKKWLLALPVLQLLWVNLHIGFIFGPFIIGVYLITFILQKDFIKVKYIGLALLSSFLAMFVNPSHIYGAIYPFKIFGAYSYKVMENQSISFLENLGIGNLYTFFAYKALLGSVLVSYISAAYVNWKKVSLPILIYGIVFGLMGWASIRDFPLFGLISIIAIAMNLSTIYDDKNIKLGFTRNENFIALITVVTILAGSVLITGLIADRSKNFGIGVAEGIEKAAEFFKKNNLKGPIFNNYDIGGYLIYNLFPTEKVYFDNRPEAYSKKFVNEEYIKALENPEVFNEIDKKYKFNAIFYYYRDYTPWGQTFITNKVFDPSWAPVYADKSIIILLKRNGENMPVIKKYEMSRDSFRIIK